MFNPFNPTHWAMFPIGAAFVVLQAVVMPPSRRPVELDDLGHLGGDPHFEPPQYDPILDRLQGKIPDWKRDAREKQQQDQI